MTRRPDRVLPALLLPLLAFIAFGAARVDAPVSLIGLVFDHPRDFAIAALVVTFAGAALLFVRPIERRVARVFAPARAPTAAEEQRLRHVLEQVGDSASLDTTRMMLLVQETSELNAAAGAARLLFVTEGALERDDAELEALIAHELGHHRGLHPIATTVVWWLALPGELLARLYALLRRVAGRVTGRVPVLAPLVAVLLLIWQLSVMWLYYIGKLLMQRAARMSEFVADRAAVRWGYAQPLLALYRSAPEPEPSGRLERLLADHPPLEQRIARIEAATLPAAA